MNNRLRAVCFGVCALIAGVSIFRADVPLQAQDMPDVDVRQINLAALPVAPQARLMPNRVVACSTNPAYRQGEFGHYIASLNPINQANNARIDPNHRFTAADCRSCHDKRTPTIGSGDRPLTSFAAFALANYSRKRQEFLIYAGEKGQGEWKKYQIDPGVAHQFSWPYNNPNDRRSPVFWIGHEGMVSRVEPMATPNQDIGSLYCFKEDPVNATVQLTKPAIQPTRKGR